MAQATKVKTSEYNLHIGPYTPVARNQTYEIQLGMNAGRDQ